MKHQHLFKRLSIPAVLLLLLGLTVVVFAGADITLSSGPTLAGGSWEWTGTADLTNPHKYLCVAFPGSLVPSLDCTGNIEGDGVTAYTCSVSEAQFTGAGSSVAWQIAAYPNTGCGGTELVGASGNFDPTAVSLIALGAAPSASLPWLLLGLITAVSVLALWRRRAAR